jgi:cell wall assembly regulator SMI1
MDATPAGTRTWSVTASSGKSVAASTGGEEPTPAELPKGTTITVNVGVPFTLNLSWEITEFYVSGAYVTLEPMYPQIELVDGTTGYAIGELHQGEIWEAHPQFKCTEPGTYVDAIKLTWGGTNYGTWTTYIDIIATEGGIDTIGVYDPAAATFFLRNSNSAGVADLTFNYGIPNWIPIAGDWDGDGIDTIGVYNPDTATFYLRNTNTAGFADITFVYGAPNWIPIAGDWNGDGVDTIGVYDPDTATFYLRNTNTTGFADITFVYGMPNWIPIAGDWDGDGTSANSLLSTAASARNEVLQVSCTPNPLRREKSVTFSVVGEPEVQAIRVRVYDLAGELVWQSEAGGNILAWEAEDLTGRPLPNGVYLYVVEAKISGNWQNLGVYKLLILR